MRGEPIIKNLVYFILIAISFSLGIFFIAKHNLNAKYSLEYNIFYLNGIIIIFFGAIGLILGISNKNISIKNIGDFKLNKFKLIFLALPSLIFSLTYVWLYLGVFELFPVISRYIQEVNCLVIMSSVVLGHTLVSSMDFKK